jgi:hypothetical protein
MSIFGTRDEKSILDKKLCFDLWIELGSLNKVSMELYNRGVKNTLTDKPFTGIGVRSAAFIWMLYNLDEAFETF